MIGRPPRPLAERYWAKVSKAGPDDCWAWTAYKDAVGYGRLRHPDGRATIYAHRVAYALAHGLDPAALPADLVIRHRCDNPGCVNPAHLEEGTHADNSRDMVERSRAARGEAHGRAKLTQEQADEIRVATGTQREIAARYGIHRSTISLIKLGKIWSKG